MRKFFVVCLLAAVVCVPALGEFTIGESVSVTYKGEVNKAAVHLYNHGDNPYVYVGMPQLTIDGSWTDAFCIDLDQTVKKGDSWTATIDQLSDAPIPSNTLAGPMGSSKASLIKKLWTVGYADAQTSKSGAIGMQLAIWNIIYDNDTSVANLAGDFYAKDNPSNAIATADNLLSTVYNDSGSIAEANLLALVSDSTQDFTIIELSSLSVVPAPGAILLGSIGTALVGYLRRKRSL